MREGERLILRSSEIVGFDSGYFYDDHFPTQEQDGRGREYRHIPFTWNADKAPDQLSADCVVPDTGRFGIRLTAQEEFLDIELTIQNEREIPMAYVDWFFCVVGLESPSIGDGMYERTFLFDGETFQKLTGGGAEKIYHVTGPQGGDGFIPPLHAEPRHPRGPVDAGAALVMVQSVDGNHTAALGFERSHSIYSSSGNRCFHADPSFGLDLQPGEQRKIRGRLYLMKGAPSDALDRFRKDFPW